MNHTCSECSEDFEPDSFPFGDDVQCPHCGVWLETEFEQLTYDSMANWVTGKAKDQRRNILPQQNKETTT